MSTVSAVLAISFPWPYPLLMCNLTALSPDRPAAMRHRCGTPAATQRSRTTPPAPPQRPKAIQIRYLCAPHCGLFSATGTAWPRFCSLFAIKSLQNCVAYQENLIIYTTWHLHHFLIPNFYLGLPFSPPAPILVPIAPWKRGENVLNPGSFLPPFSKGGPGGILISPRKSP
jgi:hypothetical protein